MSKVAKIELTEDEFQVLKKVVALGVQQLYYTIKPNQLYDDSLLVSRIINDVVPIELVLDKTIQ